MRQKTLIVMVKEPRAGRVKTRLGREIGMTAAAWWYRHQTARLLRGLADPRWQIILSVAPDRAVESRAWPANLPRCPQRRGDLGVRMRNALRLGKGPTVLIGSDIPGVTVSHIERAFAALRSANTVIGPAEDGGFWLVGIARPHSVRQSLFRNARWSHPETLGDVLPSLPPPVAFVDRLNDVDQAADL